MPSGSFLVALRDKLQGEVRDDAGTIAAYSTDASNHRVVPLAVAFPRNEDDVTALAFICAESEVPITARGAGTNIAGNAIGRGVIVDFSRHMKRISSIDPGSQTAVVQPGVVLDDLRRSTAPFGLTFGPDPSTHSRCTIGGMIGTNACGSHSVAWGTTVDNVESLEIVLADGTSISLGGPSQSSSESHENALRELGSEYRNVIKLELGRFRRQVSGYGLHHLISDDRSAIAKSFVGSEGTCGLITKAQLRLVEVPNVRKLVIAGFVDILEAARAASQLATLGPLTVEGMDHQLVTLYDNSFGPRGRPQLPAGNAWLLLEVSGASHDELSDRAAELVGTSIDAGATATHIATLPEEQASFWHLRERAAGLVSRSRDGREFWPGWEDSAVPAQNLHLYVRDFEQLLAAHGRLGVLYGHFGEGCLHVRIDHDMFSESGRKAYRAFQVEAAELCRSYGGSLSGEHGDGRARSELLSRMYSPSVIAAFSKYKAILDPRTILNPGIIVRPSPLDADLRYSSRQAVTVRLSYKLDSDDGDLSKALRRCVGVGSCRQDHGGGMCPSFRATQDERHSTRGRARILSELLSGELSDVGWRSKDARDALDLCLSCKSCRSECPVSVDMATYKAEFLSNHYKRRLRPMSHYTMGWLPLWLRLARPWARFSNWLLRSDCMKSLVKRLAGLTEERNLPTLNTSNVRRWFRRRASHEGRPTIVLWVDTFTGGLEPDRLKSAIYVLEAAGYSVELSPRSLCCGLTWVTTGQLGAARRIMRRTVRRLDGLGGDDREIVVLEPSCASALKHDVPEIVGGQASRRVADRVRTLAEILEHCDLPVGDEDHGEVVTQFHCHQRATIGTSADRSLLSRLGYRVTSVDEGCCGGAGSFGFERGHFQISKTCAEQSFLPIVAPLPAEVPILADGYSCQTQIEQFGGRRPLHLAQLIHQLIANSQTDGMGRPGSGN